jgi:hypothetical protein
MAHDHIIFEPVEVHKHHELETMLYDESAEPRSLELSLLQDITNNFSDDHEIGRNRFGVVYKVCLVAYLI